jgi:hypothetical protein
LHFGLGKSDRLDTLAVYWPDGRMDTFYAITSLDRYYTLVENEPLAVDEMELETSYHPEKHSILIRWRIQTTNPFVQFVLERSYDTLHWKPLLFFSYSEYQSGKWITWLDSHLTFGHKSVFYRLQARKTNGRVTYSKIVHVDLPMPRSFFLFQNVPNPFNEETIISYRINEKGRTRLNVYDCTGRKMCSLVNQIQLPGVYRVRWNGEDQKKGKIASGIYFVELTQGKRRQIIKTIFLK